MTIDAGELAHDVEDWADTLSGLVQSHDNEGGFGDADPVQLLTLLGGLAAMMRFANMLAAQTCDGIATIAARALEG